MMASKVNIDPDNFRWVETVDFSKFLKDNFSREDRIVLKVDIEGLEYDLLEKMLAEGTVSYVERLFCEWHKEKAGIPEDRHCRLIESLQKAGLSVTGENETDEFKKVMSGVKFNPSAFL